MYEYKIVAVPPSIDLKGTTQKGQEAAMYLKAQVNEHAAEGWDFYRIDRVGFQVPGSFVALAEPIFSGSNLTLCFRRHR
ncbi:DUF4177 domain-containing protein [Stutzerimonas stutzeri]|uniref:DUF4177 domain-containing protein n=1 Tax=Stutzerimonas stutzeri TaxID=316 RepID=UPI0016459B10|nr:DUF4177 domain-containing protein [Stutzerimonas stutzeri]